MQQMTAAVSVIEGICREHQIPYRKFSNRSDMRGGSTLGALSSSLLSMKTVDAGVPMLAMHSARELMGSKGSGSFSGSRYQILPGIKKRNWWWWSCHPERTGCSPIVRYQTGLYDRTGNYGNLLKSLAFSGEIKPGFSFCCGFFVVVTDAFKNAILSVRGDDRADLTGSQ